MTEPKHPTLCEGVELTQGEVEEVTAMFTNPLEKALTKYWEVCDEAEVEQI